MNETLTQAQHAEIKLRNLILNMEIAPGERITERDIVGFIGISRTSIRTALFKLASEGLVIHKKSGWIVSPINLEEISQVCIYRKILEVAAIQETTQIVIDKNISKVENLLNSISPTSTHEQLNQIGHDFHIWIAKLSENEFIIQGTENAMMRLRRARWLENKYDHTGWDEHRQIVIALKKGKIQKTISLIENHISRTRQSLLSTLQKKQLSLRVQGAFLTSK